MYLALTFNTKKSLFIFVQFLVNWKLDLVSCTVKHITGSNPSSLNRLNLLSGNKEWKGTQDEL